MKRAFGRVPIYFFTGMEWFIQLAFLVLAAGFCLQALTEHRNRRMFLAAVERYRRLKTAFTNFLNITNHYLNTSVAIVTGAGDLSKPSPKTKGYIDAFAIKANQLVTKNQITGEVVEGQNYLLGGKEQSAPFLPKAVWLPLVCALACLIITDVLFMTAGTVDMSFDNIGIQALVTLFTGILLVVVGRYLRNQHIMEAASKQELATEKAAETQQVAFLNESVESLTPQLADLQSITPEIAGTPAAKPFAGGLAMLSDLLISLNKLRMYSDASSLAVQQIDIAELYRSLEVELQQAAQAKHLTYNVEIAPGTQLVSNPGAVSQLIRSTALNAIKFSKEAGEVSLTAAKKGRMVVITITDSGIGMSSEKLKDISAPYQRANSAETYDHEGLGLDLAIDNILVEKIAGQIVVISKEQVGTKVTITLPRTIPKV